MVTLAERLYEVGIRAADCVAQVDPSDPRGWRMVCDQDPTRAVAYGGLFEVLALRKSLRKLEARDA